MTDWIKENLAGLIMAVILAVGMLVTGLVNGWS